MTRIGTLVTKSMTVLDSTDENRFFEGYLTVEMKDKQGEITVVDELYKVLPIWIDRGAPITDTHSNRVIGKGINFAKTTVEDGGVTYPAIKITGKIHKNYELDTDIWEKIKSGEYKGLSFGGATKANRVPKVMKDGDIAYALTDLEHYEVAVCKDPAVPLALITEFNSVAKATVPSEPRGDGKEVIKCTKFGCYVTKSEGEDEPEYHDESLIKGEDWSNADIPTSTVTNTVSQSTQTAKPIKTDKKVGVPENEGGLKINVTPLEGGIADNQYKKNDTPAGSSVGGGVRQAPPEKQSNQDNPKDQTAQVSEKIETLHKSDINKVIGAILAGAQRVKSSQSSASEDPPKKPKEEASNWHGGKRDEKGKPERAGKKKQPLLSNSWEALRQEWGTIKAIESINESMKSLGALGWGKLNRDGSKQKLRKRQPKLDDFVDEKKSGYQTEYGNNQLGGQAVPTEKEKLTSSLGAQNKQTKVTIREKSNYCPSCGQKKSPEMKRDYPETESQGSLCPSCRQDSQRREADAKGKKESEAIASGLHRDLKERMGKRGIKVERY